MKREFELKHLDQIEMGRRIRKQREFLDFTREDLAGYLGVSSKFIADIEYGEKGISIRKLYMLSQILEVSADYILAGERYGNAVDVERDRLKEEILEPLKICNTQQLKCMEQIAKFYVEALKEMKLSKEELMKRHDILCEKYILIKDFVSNLGVPENYREDLIQEIFVAAYINIHKLNDMDRLNAWLYRISYRKMILFGKAHRVRFEKRYLIRTTTVSQASSQRKTNMFGAQWIIV